VIAAAMTIAKWPRKLGPAAGSAYIAVPFD